MLIIQEYADGILLAARGGEDLLQRTQKAYFERRTIALPYLCLFQSIVTNDLADIVQNADLQEWQETFVVLCTFVGAEEFSDLAERLGARLQSTIVKDLEDPDALAQPVHSGRTRRSRILLLHRLERLVNILIEERLRRNRGWFRMRVGGYYRG
jgi:protein transport protein SEC31